MSVNRSILEVWCMRQSSVTKDVLLSEGVMTPHLCPALPNQYGTPVPDSCINQCDKAYKGDYVDGSIAGFITGSKRNQKPKALDGISI